MFSQGSDGQVTFLVDCKVLASPSFDIVRRCDSVWFFSDGSTVRRCRFSDSFDSIASTGCAFLPLSVLQAPHSCFRRPSVLFLVVSEPMFLSLPDHIIRHVPSLSKARESAACAAVRPHHRRRLCRSNRNRDLGPRGIDRSGLEISIVGGFRSRSWFSSFEGAFRAWNPDSDGPWHVPGENERRSGRMARGGNVERSRVEQPVCSHVELLATLDWRAIQPSSTQVRRLSTQGSRCALARVRRRRLPLHRRMHSPRSCSLRSIHTSLFAFHVR